MHCIDLRAIPQACTSDFLNGRISRSFTLIISCRSLSESSFTCTFLSIWLAFQVRWGTSNEFERTFSYQLNYPNIPVSAGQEH
jgi:hypothetical protein